MSVDLNSRGFVCWAVVNYDAGQKENYTVFSEKHAAVDRIEDVRNSLVVRATMHQG